MKNTHKPGCNEFCKPQKDLQSEHLLNTASSAPQLSSDEAKKASKGNAKPFCTEMHHALEEWFYVIVHGHVIHHRKWREKKSLWWLDTIRV